MNAGLIDLRISGMADGKVRFSAYTTTLQYPTDRDMSQR